MSLSVKMKFRVLWEFVCVFWGARGRSYLGGKGQYVVEDCRLGAWKDRMRSEIYFRSYSMYFIEGLLHAPGNSGRSVHADHKTGISLAHGFDSLVTRL